MNVEENLMLILRTMGVVGCSIDDGWWNAEK